ncbi:MAG: translational GTPase TypA [Limnochordia bacterium]
MELRNIAIIAHVDHGKTTLVDAFLKQTGVLRTNQRVNDRILDSGDLERERGITILAKNTAVFHRGVKINIVDTPGHADFAGEVERIMGMVDGVLLVVDGAEGPLPQTRYVLQKALAQDLFPIVVINKIDRADARPEEVLDEVLELFIDLGATDRQLDFPVVWAVARDGLAHLDLAEAQGQLAAGQGSILPLLDTILDHVPPPQVDKDGPLQLQITTVEYDDYVGRLALGRITRGHLAQGMVIGLCTSGGMTTHKIPYLYNFARLKREPISSAPAGEIVAIGGIEDISIGDTIVDPEHPEPLPPLKLDEPTITVLFRVNDGPFAGQEGQYVTSRQLRERLYREARTDVALRVDDTESPDTFALCGRGELHLGILIEKMRREGYEFTVSKPQPVLKEIDGVICEPIEHVFVDIPEEHTGTVIELLGQRKGEMINMAKGQGGDVRLEFLVPARGLVGLRSLFLTETKGYGVLTHSFHSYQPFRGEIPGRPSGSLVALEEGVATAYAIIGIQERARLFIEPGTRVYGGMIIGENSRPQDLEVNIAKKRHVTNIRSSTAEIAERLDAPVQMGLEEALAFIAIDELVEVTPQAIRLRKAILDRHKRHNQKKGG